MAAQEAQNRSSPPHRSSGLNARGFVPLGCDVKDRKLVINDVEAATVRRIFERFTKGGFVTDLVRARPSRRSRLNNCGGRALPVCHGACSGAGRQVILFRADLKIMVATQPVDFRKSVHTLSALVSEELRADPYCGDVFIFRSKRLDRVKLLAWDGSGMVLVMKWLEEGRFTWPPIRDRCFFDGDPIVDVDRRAGLDARGPESREAARWRDVKSAHCCWRIRRISSIKLGWRFGPKIFLPILLASPR